MHLLLAVCRQMLRSQEKGHLDKRGRKSMAGRLDQTCRRGVQVNQLYWPRHEDDQTWDMHLSNGITSQRKLVLQSRWLSLHRDTNPQRTINLCVGINFDAYSDLSFRRIHVIVSVEGGLGPLQSSYFGREKPGAFRAILAQDNPAVFVKILLIRRADDTDGDQLKLICSDRSLQKLTVRPTIAVVHQVHKRRFTTGLRGMDSPDSPILPALQEIRLIDMETTQLPGSQFIWTSLTD
ncbi:hypothetical protein BDW71DRAFT_195494 [Aspergillus fruticulosus]